MQLRPFTLHDQRPLWLEACLWGKTYEEQFKLDVAAQHILNEVALTPQLYVQLRSHPEAPLPLPPRHFNVTTKATQLQGMLRLWASG